MRNTLFVATLLCLLGGTAFAEDAQSQQQPTADNSSSSTTNWTGFYGGVSGGASQGNSDQGSYYGNRNQPPITGNSGQER